MTLTRTRFSQLLRMAALAVVIIVIIGYAITRSLPYFQGPEIAVFQPLNGSTISSTTMTLIGRARRINSLSINNHPIQIDEQGNFRETLIVFPGINVISLDATDQFKRSTHSELRILGTEPI